MDKKITVITVDLKVKERLKKIKRKNGPPRRPGTRQMESYPSVINRVIDALERSE